MREALRAAASGGVPGVGDAGIPRREPEGTLQEANACLGESIHGERLLRGLDADGGIGTRGQGERTHLLEGRRVLEGEGQGAMGSVGPHTNSVRTALFCVASSLWTQR